MLFVSFGVVNGAWLEGSLEQRAQKTTCVWSGRDGESEAIDLEIILCVETWALVQAGDTNRK